MTDMRRTLLWVVFATSLFLLWDGWRQANGQASLLGGPRPAAVAEAPHALPASTPGAVPAPANGATPAATTPAPGAAPAPVPPVGDTVTVTTDLVRASFSTLGGSLVRLELLRHTETPKQPWFRPFLALFGAAGPAPEPHPIVLFDHGERQYLAQTGLVPAHAGTALPNHLTTMSVAPGPRELAEGASELAIRFESAPVEGRRLVKTYTFKRGDYAIGVKHELVNDGSTPVEAQLYLQLLRDAQPGDSGGGFYSTFTGPAMWTDEGHYRKLQFKDIAKGDPPAEPRSDNGWIAMVQHYFASAWLVPAKGEREFRTAREGNDLYSIAMVLPLGEVAPGASATHEAVLFAGPQQEKKLEALAPGLERVKDYGWLTPLSKPLFWLLSKLHGVLGNWGWAIVALVVLLKIAFYWLNASAYRSMAKMRAVAPRLTEMRERLKDNPQQMQQEMMRIYREEKVNPLGGCLPVLVQMPFFIALYWVLLSSVEMRGAPWIGWIHDLALPDPFFILPVLMTITSLIQVALGNKAPDPMQQRMMWMMPLLFSFMFFFFPAGLVLYWLTNNILSNIQQWVINKRMHV